MMRRIRKGEKWNPRFVAYAKAHGRTPKQQVEHDEHKMHEFMIWMNGYLVEWRKKFVGGEDPVAWNLLTEQAQDAFTSYLFEQANREERKSMERRQ